VVYVHDPQWLGCGCVGGVGCVGCVVCVGCVGCVECGGVGVWGGGGGGPLLTFDIPQTALVATLDTYYFNLREADPGPFRCMLCSNSPRSALCATLDSYGLLLMKTIKQLTKR
jgi:hypothetical protein